MIELNFLTHCHNQALRILINYLVNFICLLIKY